MVGLCVSVVMGAICLTEHNVRGLAGITAGYINIEGRKCAMLIYTLSRELESADLSIFV